MALQFRNNWINRRRPDYPLELDYSHPSNTGWLRFWEFGTTTDPRAIHPRNIGTWTKATYYAGRTRTAYGPCTYSGGGAYDAGGFYTSDNGFRTSITTRLTAHVLYMPASSTNSDFIFGNTQVRAGGDYNWGIYRANSTSAYAVYHQNSSLTKVNVFASSNSAPLNTLKLVTLTYDGANLKVYVDGAFENSIAQTGNTLTSSYEITFNEWSNPGAGIATQAGWYFYAGVANRVWDDSEIRELSKNYWQLFRRPVSPIVYSFYTSTSDISVAITGQNSTFNYGTLIPANSIRLTGNSATFSGGTLTPSLAISAALTGLSASFSRGTLTPSLAKSLTGQSATFSGGTLAPVTGITVNLTGQSFTGSVGSLKAALAVNLLGQSVTASDGTITPSVGGNVSVNLSGISGTFSYGTLTAGQGLPPETMEFSWSNKKAKFSFKARYMNFDID